MVLAAAPGARGVRAHQSDLGVDQPLPFHIVQEGFWFVKGMAHGLEPHNHAEDVEGNKNSPSSE